MMEDAKAWDVSLFSQHCTDPAADEDLLLFDDKSKSSLKLYRNKSQAFKESQVLPDDVQVRSLVVKSDIFHSKSYKG